MATITTIVRRTSPSFRQSGTEQPSYQSTWLIEANDSVPGGQVLFLAQHRSGDDAVPLKGDKLRWISRSGDTYIDSGAFALDFNVALAAAPESFPHLWKIDVTWRAPRPGKDEQGGSVGVPPLSRPPEYNVQFHTTQEEVTLARNVIAIGSGFITRDPLVLGPITTAASERVQGFFKDRLKATLVCQKNVVSPAVALKINNEFEDTINNSTWSTPWIQVAKHHARFLRAETGDQITEGVFRFWRMRVSVEIGRTEFYINVPNVGTKEWDGPSSSVITHIDTDGKVSETNLLQNGTVDLVNEIPFNIPYIVQRNEAGYGSLPF